MRNLKPSEPAGRNAFTLIELLVVIAIIAILAALLFPAFQTVKKNGIRNRTKAELRQVETAIESYKAKYGFYPPDNQGNVINQLFYELQGTALKGNSFETLDGREKIPVASVTTAFGAGVAGFVNCTKGGGGDDSSVAQKFFGSGLTPSQYGFATNNGVRIGLLTCSVPWPANLPPPIVAVAPELNPIRYNSSSPVHNPKSFDLWVDVVVGGKINRFCNWNADYVTVSSPFDP